MSKISNNQGRAYEFACLNVLYEEICKKRTADIVKNSSYYAAEKAYNTISEAEKILYRKSALAMVSTIFECEPNIIENNKDLLELYIQQDAAGKQGDVRDIIIVRKDIKWEIGFSVKHNHFAVKHNRLSPTIDFGKIWYNIPCSTEYWKAVNPVFNYLKQERDKNTKFNELLDKDNNVYKKIIAAFIDEINRQYAKDKTIPQKLVEFLLGKFDFYKIISIDHKKITQIQSYNLHGDLNKTAKTIKPSIIIPISALPTRIVKLDFYPERLNTAELYLDNGWSFTFRIHNAETYVNTSLKFDIQIVGLPATIVTINCTWK